MKEQGLGMAPKKSMGELRARPERTTAAAVPAAVQSAAASAVEGRIGESAGVWNGLEWWQPTVVEAGVVRVWP